MSSENRWWQAARHGRRGSALFQACVAAGVGSAVVWAAGLAVAPAGAATVSWTGAGGANWATSGNWTPAGGPGTADTANFTDTGSFTLPGEVTSLLNADRTVGGLIFTNGTSKYHTLDLNGRTLTVAGNAHFNTDGSGITTTTLRNGTLVLNGAFSTFNVARAVAGSSNGSADLSGLTALTASVQEWNVGTSAANAAKGTLWLSPSNAVTTGKWNVGVSTGTGEVTGTVHLGLANTVSTAEANIGKERGAATVDIVNGGSLTLGSLATRTNLSIATVTALTNSAYSGTLDLTGGTFNGYLSGLTVGTKDNGGFGSATGIFRAGAGGSVDIGAAGNTANVFVGRKVAGNNDDKAVGIVDFGGLSSLTANLNQLGVGLSNGGPSTGTLTLAAANTIDAKSIVVGTNGGTTNLLALGRTNTLVTDQLVVAQGSVNANVTVPGGTGNSVALGSAARRTSVSVSTTADLSNGAYAGSVNLTGAAFTGYLADVTIGQKDNGGVGSATGSFVAGGGGTVNIGAPGNTANVYVARKVSGNNDDKAYGTLDFRGLASLAANLNTLGVGVSNLGTARGSVLLADTNTIDAKSIVVGVNGGSANVLTFGRVNTVLADQFVAGQGQTNASVTVTPGTGASMSLGSVARRTALSISAVADLTNGDYNASVDLSGATFNGYLADVTIGQKDNGGFGSATGVFRAGPGGSIDIGAGGNATNVYIGRKVTGNNDDKATGVLDLGRLDSLTANLNTLSVGVANAGLATGTVTLPATATIDAKDITVGAGGNSNATSLTLGRTNAILADQLFIGKDASGGTVTLPAGGTLTLGSPARRTTVSVASGGANDNNGWVGTLDLGGGTVTAYLDTVTIANKTSTVSNKSGVLTIGARPDNFVSANSISLGGGNTTASGTLNFGGGQLFANAVSKGAATANFNWTGGQLSVGTFGTVAFPFNLANGGTGTLAPGSLSAPVGTTAVYGNYSQASTAATTLQIAGNTAGTGNDQLVVSGSATLGGTLNVSLLNGFAPSVGQSYLLATYGSRTGTFAFVAPPTLPANVAFALDYTSIPTQLQLKAVAPAAQTWAAGTSGAFSAAGNWNTGTTPTTNSDLAITNPTASAETVSVSASTTVHRVLLQGTSGPVTLDVPQGVKLGVANQVTVGTNASLTGGGQVLGNVVVQAGGSVAPGTPGTVGTLQVAGNVTAQTGASVRLDVAGKTPGTQHDQLNIAGVATVGGTFRVDLLGGYTPAWGDTFDVATWAGVAGRFAGEQTNAPAGYGFAPAYTAAKLTLTYARFGDTDLNGNVGFDDFNKLAAHYGRGTDAGWADGDFDLDGSVGFTDFNLLAANYGKSAGSPAAGGLSADQRTAFEAVLGVPEPGSAGVAIAAVALGLLGRRRRSRGR